MNKFYLLAPLLTSCLAQPDPSLYPLEPDCLLELEKKQQLINGVHKFSLSFFDLDGKKGNDLLYRIETVLQDYFMENTFIDFQPIGDLDVAYKNKKGEVIKYLDVENQILQESHTLVLDAFTRKYCDGEDFFTTQQYGEFQKTYQSF